MRQGSKTFRGSVEQWEIHELPNEGEFVFTGTVADAPADARFEGGRHIKSSLIVNLRMVDDFIEVQTLNSIYHLIGPAGDERLRAKLKLLVQFDDSEVLQ